MSIIKNKKGIGIPTVLGIVTFVIATVATLLTVAVNQSKLIDRSIESTEAYANSVQAVDATLKIIARDQNLDPAYLDALELYMGVTIEAYGESLYMISSMVTTSKSVSGYITGTAAATSTYDELLAYTGREPEFVLSPLITPTSLLASYLPTFMDTELPGVVYPSEFLTFASIISYIRSIALVNDGYTRKTAAFLASNPTVSGHWYVDGNVTIPNAKNLSVPDGYLLFIDGNLTMNRSSSIIGNVVVDGNVTINSNNNSNTQYIRGTIYARGTVSSTRKIVLGTDVRPAFVFAEANVSFTNTGSTLSGTGYFLCDTFTATKKSVSLTGGVYASVAINPANLVVTPQASLNEANFYTWAIPAAIATEGGDPEVIEFIYTFPKLN
jgi:hypothetical protein